MKNSIRYFRWVNSVMVYLLCKCSDFICSANLYTFFILYAMRLICTTHNIIAFSYVVLSCFIAVFTRTTATRSPIDGWHHIRIPIKNATAPFLVRYECMLYYNKVTLTMRIGDGFFNKKCIND